MKKSDVLEQLNARILRYILNSFSTSGVIHVFRSEAIAPARFTVFRANFLNHLALLIPGAIFLSASHEDKGTFTGVSKLPRIRPKDVPMFERELSISLHSTTSVSIHNS